MSKTKYIYKFKRGQNLSLDQIYDVQGLGGGNWWEADDPSEAGGTGGEEVTILEDITITITVSRKS